MWFYVLLLVMVEKHKPTIIYLGQPQKLKGLFQSSARGKGIVSGVDNDGKFISLTNGPL